MSDIRSGSVSDKPLIPKVKDTDVFKEAAILLGWIAALIIIAGLCWSLTEPVRNRMLLNAVNRVLEQYGDSRRLDDPISPPEYGGTSGSFTLGYWFNMTDNTKVFIFGFNGGGTFFPCAAIMSPDGKVQEFIPLNNYGKRTIETLPLGILKINARRIEGAKS